MEGYLLDFRPLTLNYYLLIPIFILAHDKAQHPFFSNIIFTQSSGVLAWEVL